MQPVQLRQHPLLTPMPRPQGITFGGRIKPPAHPFPDERPPGRSLKQRLISSVAAPAERFREWLRLPADRMNDLLTGWQNDLDTHRATFTIKPPLFDPDNTMLGWQMQDYKVTRTDRNGRREYLNVYATIDPEKTGSPAENLPDRYLYIKYSRKDPSLLGWPSLTLANTHPSENPDTASSTAKAFQKADLLLKTLLGDRKYQA